MACESFASVEFDLGSLIPVANNQRTYFDELFRKYQQYHKEQMIRLWWSSRLLSGSRKFVTDSRILGKVKHSEVNN